ncbi:MAG: MBL fold metallo-hydrolase [Patescibacteria group bacterium]|jgi:competence protein ComEC|nr:MBL fold metallo-hydrolase [Patescibacteria group bacterium]
MNKWQKIYLFFGIVIILITVFLFIKNNVSKKLEVIFFDVGQGDSALIKTPYGQDIVIDGSPDNSVLEKLSSRLGFWNNDIELMILTHPHEDHLTGLIEIIRRYDVERIMYSGIDYDSIIYKTFLEEAEREGAEIIVIDKKQRIKLGDNLYFDILYPEKDISKEVHKNVNNTSVISRLAYGDKSFLFMGDAEREEELEIIDNGGLESDVLKLAHHGSKTNDENFINIVSPEYAVISVGEDNKFGHPNIGVLNMLNKIGTKIFRTDAYGDISFFSDGVGLGVVY